MKPLTCFPLAHVIPNRGQLGLSALSSSYHTCWPGLAVNLSSVFTYNQSQVLPLNVAELLLLKCSENKKPN